MRTQYDFASMKGGVRGKYYEQYRKGTDVILIGSEVAAAVNPKRRVRKSTR